MLFPFSVSLIVFTVSPQIFAKSVMAKPLMYLALVISYPLIETFVFTLYNPHPLA